MDDEKKVWRSSDLRQGLGNQRLTAGRRPDNGRTAAGRRLTHFALGGA